MSQYYYHEKCKEGHYRINSPERVYIDLVVGTKQAMVIDTGYGFGNLREYVNGLTDLPLVVVNTHGHPDHVGGNHLFEDCPIYMSGKDRQLAESFFSKEKRASTVEGARQQSVDWSTGQTQNILPEGFEPEGYVNAGLPGSQDLLEGMVFDLGSIVLKAVAVPGHTCGSMALWNEETGELYVGDATGKCLLLSWGSEGFAPYRDTVRKICSMDVKEIYHGHDDIIEVWKLLEPVKALVETIGESAVYRRPCPMEPGRWDYYLVRKGHTMVDMGRESFAMVVLSEELYLNLDMGFFKSCKLSDHITEILDRSLVRIFLIEGEKRAAVIDTGTGIGSVRKYVEKLTKLPYDVICTHGHLDHAGGAGDFEEVYLHPKDFELAGEHCRVSRRLDYVKGMHPDGDIELREVDFIPARKQPYQPVADGQEFDLGGLILKLVKVPGHTQGSLCVLIKEERSMIFGDACNTNVFLFDGSATSVEEYKQSLLKLKGMDGQYDRVYFSHGLAERDRTILDDCIELCDEIMAGEDEKLPFDFMGIHALQAKKGDFNGRADGRLGNIIYNPEKIR